MSPDDSRLNLVFEKIANTSGVSRMLNLDRAEMLICRMIADTKPARKVDEFGKWRGKRKPLIVLNALASTCDDESILSRKHRVEQSASNIKPRILVADKSLAFNEVLAFTLIR